MPTGPIESPFVVTVAGGFHPSYVDGTGIEARFNEPTGLAFAPSGGLFVTEAASGRLRRIGADGHVDTYGLLGGDLPANEGETALFRVALEHGWLDDRSDRDEEPSSAADDRLDTRVQWFESEGLAISPGGLIAVGDAVDNRIWVAVDGGRARWLAGATHPVIEVARDGTCTMWDVDGPRSFPSFAEARIPQLFRDGSAGMGRFENPRGLVYLPGGDLVVADSGNGRLRRVRPDGFVDTLPGEFEAPSGVAISGDGRLYVSDSKSHAIYMVLPSGQVQLLAGGGPGFRDGHGAHARFFEPMGLAEDGAGGLWVADTGNHAIRHLAVDGTVVTVAGRGKAGASDGPAEQAAFNRPWAVVNHPAGGVLVSDRANHRIRWILPGYRVNLPVGDDGLVYADELQKGQRLPRCRPLRWLRKWNQLIGREIRSVVKEYATGRIQIYFPDAFIEIQGRGRWPPPDLLPYFKPTDDSSDFHYLPMGFVGKTIATAWREQDEARLYLAFTDGTDVLLEPYMGGALKIITSRQEVGLRTPRTDVGD